MKLIQSIIAVVLLTQTFLAAEEQKIVCAGTAITEIVCALGSESQIVARDSTSTYPASVLSKPVIGYVRALPSEGIIASSAKVVLATQDAGPPVVIQHIQDAGIAVHQFTIDYTVAGVAQRIKEIGEIIGKQQLAATLAREVSTKLSKIVDDNEFNSQVQKSKMTALYILHPQGGTALVGGSGTSADALMKLLGLKNAAHGLQGWKPISAEAVIEENPSIILIGASEYQQIGKQKGLSKLPGIALTEACTQENILVVDHGEMLSFGPRLVSALNKLRTAIIEAQKKRK